MPLVVAVHAGPVADAVVDTSYLDPGDLVLSDAALLTSFDFHQSPLSVQPLVYLLLLNPEARDHSEVTVEVPAVFVVAVVVLLVLLALVIVLDGIGRGDDD